MGESSTILGTCGSGVAGMTDKDILAVINPPASERDRTALVAAGNTILPSQNAWR